MQDPVPAAKSELTLIPLYVGPTLPRIGLIRNTVYSEVPKAAQEAFEKSPQLRALFLKDNRKYPTVAADLERGRTGRDTGGFYYQAYQAAAKEFGGEKL